MWGDRMVDSQFRGVKIAQVLEQLLEEHLLHPNSILQSKDTIRAFGVYTIVKEKTHFKIYKNKDLATEISSAKCALAWCIADKYNDTCLAHKIKTQDYQYSSKKYEIACYKNILNSTVPTSRKIPIEHKLQETFIQAKYIKKHLDKCLNLAKYYQLKGFENETSRLGIKYPTKVSKGI